MPPTGVYLGIAGVVVGAAGVGVNAYGASKANQAGTKPGAQSYYAANPQANQLLGALGVEGLLGLGQGNLSTALSVGSPSSQVMASIGQGNFDNTFATRAQLGLAQLANAGSSDLGPVWANMDPNQRLATVIALQNAGYPTVGAFQKAQTSFVQQQQALQAKLAPLQAEVFRGREAAYQGISQLAQSYPTTAADAFRPGNLANQFEQSLQAQSQFQYNQQVQQQQAAAQAGGYNPAGALGRLGQQQLLNLQSMPLTALSEAQNFAGAGIQTLQGILSPAIQSGLQTAGLQTGAQLSASQISGQQSIAQAQLASQSQLAALQLQNSSLNSAVGAGSNSINNAALLQILNSRGPGTPTGGGGYLGGGGAVQQPAYQPPGNVA